MAVGDTDAEKDFRERYAAELRKKRANRMTNPHFGSDELADEMKRISRQEMATPGRRGEEIKREEINKEILRRKALDGAASNSDPEK